jgi:hypothetical protein
LTISSECPQLALTLAVGGFLTGVCARKKQISYYESRTELTTML